jgi:predicted Holliday junction resolvase-like endonuclease
MDILVFIIVVIAFVFIYYLINVIKDLQLEIKTMSIKCNSNNTEKNIDFEESKSIETIDKKIKNDIVYFLDIAKNFFI